jgi:hypothetical protein
MSSAVGSGVCRGRLDGVAVTGSLVMSSLAEQAAREKKLTRRIKNKYRRRKLHIPIPLRDIVYHKYPTVFSGETRDQSGITPQIYPFQRRTSPFLGKQPPVNENSQERV